MAHQHTFSWQGRQIAWSRFGSGPPVVLLHGTPFSAQLWAPYAEELGSRYAVHTFDLPGYGESSQDPEHPVDLGVHARAFAALTEHWGLTAPHVVAHDLGGGVALRAHLVEGLPLSSLLLVDAVAVPPTGSPFFRLVARHPDVLAQLPGHIHEAVLGAYIRGASHRGIPDETLARLVSPWTGETGQRAFYRQVADYDEALLAENERRIGDLRMPVRVLWGREDTWMPVRAGRRLHSLIPGAEWREIAEAGHLVQLDAPVALSHEITTWLAARSR